MTSIGRTQLETALRALGELLASRGLHYEVVLIGGGNLIRGRDFPPAQAVQRLKDLEEQLAAAYQRWAELEP